MAAPPSTAASASASMAVLSWWPNQNNVHDFSRFVLFESTGESDAASFSSGEIAAVAGDDDDAESCSYNNGEDCSIDYISSSCYWSLDEVSGFIAGDEEEGFVKDMSVGCFVSESSIEVTQVGRFEKCREPLNEEVISEVEKNKLFWEACLAS